jgi:hypothetical protein
MSKKTMTPTEERQKQEESETNEMILAEDTVQTTVYLANAPDCCSGAEQLGNVLGMLGVDVMDEDVYHTEDQHPKLSMQ